MALADRDYARSTPAARSSHATGRLRMLSVTGWLIIINVAVFLLNNIVLGGVLHRVEAGTLWRAEATPAQKARARIDRSITKSPSDMPGYFYHPIYDPQSPLVDPAGRPMVTLIGGRVQPVYQEIGGERFTMRRVLEAFGHFSTGKAFLELQVWRFLSFQFLHVNFTHLLFNMLGLWFVGTLVEDYLGRRRYLAFYLACGLFGAVAYLTLNLLGYIVLQSVAPGLKDSIPALLFDDMYTPLLGASAGVFGVLMAAAYIAPSAIVDVFFVLPMKLRTAVYIFLGLAFLNLLRGGNNAGGDAAHVGGAIAGYILIRRTHLLRDFFDIFGDSRRAARTPAHLAEVDRVLKKVNAQGLQSLTERERAVLQRASAASASGGS